MSLEIGKCQLRSIRKSANMTQVKLCEKLARYGIEVTPQFISNLERNAGSPANHLLLKAFSIIFERGMGEFYTYRW